MEKLSPFSLRKEIEDDHNISAAIVIGAIVIGLVLIFVSVLRQRLLELPHDRYKGVKQ